MKAKQFFDTSETIWPTSYKILIHQPENTLNKVEIMTSIRLIHVTAPVCCHRVILEQSTVMQV